MSNYIGFAGRMRSGKGLLTNICKKFGYQELYFALPLKQLIADLIYGNIDDVNRLKKGDKEGKWQKEMKSGDIIYLANETKIPIQTVSKVLKDHIFTNTRDMMQIIGTDLIREFNPNWHVNKIKEMIKDGEKYVFSDIRFTNERKLVEDLGGDVWFIVRPNIEEVSHHSSEETLKWADFENVIINDKSAEHLKLIWELFMDYYDSSLSARNTQLSLLKKDNDYRKKFLETKDTFNALEFLLISKDFYTYNDKFINRNDINGIKQDGNNVIVTTINGEKIIVNNSLEIEDLKFYKI